MQQYDISTFKKIFKGLDRAYGQYRSGDTKRNGKQGGQAYIVKNNVTDQLWKDHLEGKDPSLGIIPIMDDNKCHWGCIDVDSYPLDHKKIIQDIESKKLPLIVFRSKSGGAHIFLFTTEPVTAKLLREKLMDIASVIGYANCEIFPKQEEIRADRGDTGNFLNLPYFEGNEGNRYAFNSEGKSFSLNEFFDKYSKTALTAAQLENLQIIKEPDQESFDGPPCLENLMSKGIPEGGRDNTLYQYAVYAKKKHPDNWKEKIDTFNHKYMDRPLGSAQVQKTINQHEKKDYQFKCKDQPMCSVCNSGLCRSRQYGIGQSFSYDFDSLSKYESDEPIWFLNVGGKRLYLNTDSLYDQTKFAKACMEQLTILMAPVSKRDWIARIQALLATAETIEMPNEIRKVGQFDSHLESFILEQDEAAEIDEVLIGKAFKDDGKIFFKLKPLIDYLNKKRFTNFTETQMGARIRDLGGDSTKRRIREDKKLIHLWYVPENFAERDEKEFKTPDMKEQVPFA
tara:strand:+ start:1234 stop:2763 length:1530 start_codon:yes stop_codon:yes gene_type:complete